VKPHINQNIMLIQSIIIYPIQKETFNLNFYNIYFIKLPYSFMSIFQKPYSYLLLKCVEDVQRIIVT
jgi:hypothetical protein